MRNPQGNPGFQRKNKFETPISFIFIQIGDDFYHFREFPFTKSALMSGNTNMRNRKLVKHCYDYPPPFLGWADITSITKKEGGGCTLCWPLWKGDSVHLAEAALDWYTFCILLFCYCYLFCMWQLSLSYHPPPPCPTPPHPTGFPLGEGDRGYFLGT